MTGANPFPDYPVVRLRDDAREVQGRTIVTEAVQQSRDAVGEYVRQWVMKAADAARPTDSLVIGVQGDYGTGKTHLLLDAAAHVEKALEPLFPDATVIRVACLDSDPVEWFRQGFGPELKRPFLKKSVIRLYALAGIVVAESAELTRAAADRLRADYRLIKTFVKEDLLNASAVGDRFRALLAEVCPDAGEAVRLALAGLAETPTEDAATRWLAGEKISDGDAARLRLPATQLSSEADASGILIAAAAVQSYVGNPFGVMIDELEHLTRRDRAADGRGNITWLKRLLEGLARGRALVYVSGHESAWGPYSDFFDRFSRYKPIVLRKWTADDVSSLMRARAPHAVPERFGATHAEAVATLTKGNIRRVISMCRALFRESSGFSRALSEDEIREVAEKIGQSVPIEEATERVREIMEGAGLRAQTAGILETDGPAPKRVKFELIGFKDGRPRVVAELTHAVDQRFMSAAARRFVARMGEVAGTYPELLGCFICAGNIDDDVLATLKSEERRRILPFDLTQRDALRVIERELTERLKDGQGVSPEAARLQELQAKEENIKERIEVARQDDDKQLIGELQREREALKSEVGDLRSQLGASSKRLEEELSAIEQRRKAELDELYERLEQLSKQAASQRDAEIIAPQKEEVTARLQTTYADLTKPLPFSAKLRLTLSNSIAGMGLVAAVTGVVLFVLTNTILNVASDVFYIRPRPLQLVLGLTSTALISFGGVTVWRRYMKTEAYFDFSARLLREVYLQSPDPMELVKVNNLLRDSLEDSGPILGRRRATKLLAKEMPEFFSHLAERAEGEAEPNRGDTAELK